jgi:hypothetical protein
LIAVVVFPTPPFWLAMAMITEGQYSSQCTEIRSQQGLFGVVN